MSLSRDFKLRGVFIKVTPSKHQKEKFFQRNYLSRKIFEQNTS